MDIRCNQITRGAPCCRHSCRRQQTAHQKQRPLDSSSSGVLSPAIVGTAHNVRKSTCRVMCPQEALGGFKKGLTHVRGRDNMRGCRGGGWEGAARTARLREALRTGGECLLLVGIHLKLLPRDRAICKIQARMHTTTLCAASKYLAGPSGRFNDGLVSCWEHTFIMIEGVELSDEDLRNVSGRPHSGQAVQMRQIMA